MHKIKRATVVERLDISNTTARNTQNLEGVHGEAAHEEAVAEVIRINSEEALAEEISIDVAVVAAAVTGNADEASSMIQVAVTIRRVEIHF